MKNPPKIIEMLIIMDTGRVCDCREAPHPWREYRIIEDSKNNKGIRTIKLGPVGSQ